MFFFLTPDTRHLKPRDFSFGVPTLWAGPRFGAWNLIFCNAPPLWSGSKRGGLRDLVVYLFSSYAGLRGVTIEADVTCTKEGDQIGAVSLGPISSLLHSNQKLQPALEQSSIALLKQS